MPNHVHCITLNVDFDDPDSALSEELIARVRKYLQTENVACDNMISTVATEHVLKELDIFSLPAVLVYDKTGKLHKKYDGKVNIATELAPLVKQLSL